MPLSVRLYSTFGGIWGYSSLCLLRGGRSCALLMAAEGHGFDDVVLYFDHLMKHLRRENLGHVLAGGNGDIGDIDGKSEIKQAYELGKSIR